MEPCVQNLPLRPKIGVIISEPPCANTQTNEVALFEVSAMKSGVSEVVVEIGGFRSELGLGRVDDIIGKKERPRDVERGIGRRVCEFVDTRVMQE